MMMKTVFCAALAACAALVIAEPCFGIPLSAPALAGAEVVRDIPYAPENGKFGLGDLYLPQSVSDGKGGRTLLYMFYYI